MALIIPPVMPPLFEVEKEILIENTSFAGSACVHLVHSVLQKNGINTSEPQIDEGEDLIIKVSKNTWKSAQVKKLVYKQKEERYEFKFQGSNRNNYTEQDIDFFFHVVYTHYRTLIWQTESKDVPKRSDGTFIHSTNLILDKPKFKKPRSVKAQFPDKPILIHAHYNPEVVVKNINFFNPQPSPIDEYI